MAIFVLTAIVAFVSCFVGANAILNHAIKEELAKEEDNG